MTPLLRLLTEGLPSGAWRIQHFDAVRRSLVESFGHRVHMVDIEYDVGKSALLQQMATRLGFPDWFGHNWDALHDTLSEMAENKAATKPSNLDGLLVIRLIDDGTSPEPSGAVATMIEIVADVAAASGLCVLVAGGHAGIGGLGELAGKSPRSV